ncbi:SRPBCC family protein [Chitinophaga arvensicola]|uniref:Uncharacterized conserved protein YndB, AHSA1/START domain n=1 Tax=Chitinophaga arvensicola TaxID=29529 RepID=A0A1I0S6Y2_9BACT|nr:SRPBCC domain-containing protein [Chitinophaga arvensicola]SEW51109.1 Uncharacterized conserved protein YndB, AHSA1/START domain [Chitinophaga arvensicola]
MSNSPLVIERTFDAPVKAVWDAITDNKKIRQWYFDIADFKPQIGFEFTFTVEMNERQFVHLCKITDVITGKKLSYTWQYQGVAGSSEVIWELSPEGDKTKLKLTHKGIHSFPYATDRAFVPESFSNGWHHFLDKALPAYLEKEKVTV